MPAFLPFFGGRGVTILTRVRQSLILTFPLLLRKVHPIFCQLSDLTTSSLRKKKKPGSCLMVIQIVLEGVEDHLFLIIWCCLKVVVSFSDYSVQVMVCFLSSKLLPLLNTVFLNLLLIYLSPHLRLCIFMESFLCQNVSSTRARTLGDCCASLNPNIGCAGRCTPRAILCAWQNAQMFAGIK